MAWPRSASDISIGSAAWNPPCSPTSPPTSSCPCSAPCSNRHVVATALRRRVLRKQENNASTQRGGYRSTLVPAVTDDQFPFEKVMLIVHLAGDNGPNRVP